MADINKTIEVILNGRNNTGAAFAAAGRGAQSFADGTIGSVKRAVDSIFTLQNAIAGAAFVMAAKSVFSPAIEMEQFETQLAVLLGGTEQAKARLTDLTKFADQTPFELPEIVNASKILQVLTGEALSSGAGLRMVGDVAAGTGAPIGQLAVTIGRMYDGIRSGRQIGEPLMRLQELGAISGAVRGQIEALSASGASSAEVWKVAAESFGRYGGMMDKLSATAGGKISTLSDAWTSVRREVGEAALPALKVAIEDVLTEIEKLKASGELEKWGEALGSALTGLMGLLKNVAKTIDEHGDSIKHLLYIYAGYKVISEATSAIRFMHAALVASTAATNADTAATLANAAAKKTAAGAATAMGLAGKFVAGGTAAFSAAAVGATPGVIALGAAISTVTAALAGAAVAYAGWEFGKVLGGLLNIKGLTLLDLQVEPGTPDEILNDKISNLKEAFKRRWESQHGPGTADSAEAVTAWIAVRAKFLPQFQEEKDEQAAGGRPAAGAASADNGMSDKRNQEALDKIKKTASELDEKVQNARRELVEFEADKFRKAALDAADARVKALKDEADNVKTAVDGFEKAAEKQAAALQTAREKFFRQPGSEQEEKADKAAAKREARALRRLQQQIADAKANQRPDEGPTAKDRQLLKIDEIPKKYRKEFRFDPTTERKIAIARGNEETANERGRPVRAEDQRLLDLDKKRWDAFAAATKADKAQAAVKPAEAKVAAAEKNVEALKLQAAQDEADQRRAEINRKLDETLTELNTYLSKLPDSIASALGLQKPSGSSATLEKPSSLHEFASTGIERERREAEDVTVLPPEQRLPVPVPGARPREPRPFPATTGAERERQAAEVVTVIPASDLRTPQIPVPPPIAVAAPAVTVEPTAAAQIAAPAVAIPSIPSVPSLAVPAPAVTVAPTPAAQVTAPDLRTPQIPVPPPIAVAAPAVTVEPTAAAQIAAPAVAIPSIPSVPSLAVPAPAVTVAPTPAAQIAAPAVAVPSIPSVPSLAVPAPAVTVGATPAAQVTDPDLRTPQTPVPPPIAVPSVPAPQSPPPSDPTDLKIAKAREQAAADQDRRRPTSRRNQELIRLGDERIMAAGAPQLPSLLNPPAMPASGRGSAGAENGSAELLTAMQAAVRELQTIAANSKNSFTVRED